MNTAFDGLIVPRRSAIALSNSGVLSVRGSSSNDVVRIDLISSSRLQVSATIGGQKTTKRERLSAVKQIKVFGRGGNDLLQNLTSIKSILNGGTGNDRLYGGKNRDRLIGDDGNDLLEGGLGDDTLSGDGGNDRYVYSGSNLGKDRIKGSTRGDQTLDFSKRGGYIRVDLNETGWQVVKTSHLSLNFESRFAVDHVIGTKYNDTISGNANSNRFYGRAGNDKLNGREGNDLLKGGSDDDSIEGGKGDDLLYGDKGDDKYIFAGSNLGYDRVLGSTAGAKTLDFSDRGGPVDVSIYSTSKQTLRQGHLQLKLNSLTAIDNVIGTNYDDRIRGNKLSNVLRGGGGDDIIYGRAGNDDLYGGSGNDGLFGGYDKDRMWGGSGNDRFLVRGEYGIQDYRSWDARVYFKSRDKNWTDSEVEEVDRGLDLLHKLTGDDTLLEDSVAGRPSLRFYREKVGSSPTVRGSNSRSNHNITFYDALFNSNHPAMQTVIHEIGHNWDESSENSYFSTFSARSGWVYQPSNTSGKTRASDGWWYSSSVDDFARNYGRTNPREDFATSFSAYVLKVSGVISEGRYSPSGDYVSYINGNGSTPSKVSAIRSWIRSI